MEGLSRKKGSVGSGNMSTPATTSNNASSSGYGFAPLYEALGLINNGSAVSDDMLTAALSGSGIAVPNNYTDPYSDTALSQLSKKEQQALLAKQQAEMKRIEDLVKYNLRDGESARFRNVIQNCGEVNAKNAMGAYVGFSRFIVRPDTNAVIYESPDNQYFDILAKEYCHNEYLAKYPVQNLS